MPDDSNPLVSCTGIRLANGQKWRFHPTDPGSAEAIRWMADVMSLSSVSSGTELFVALGGKDDYQQRRHVLSKNPSICIIRPGSDDALWIIPMKDLASRIASETLPYGGLLIHGALVERDGSGVILAAPGGTGKTTAANRIPLPWHALSDDAALVVRDGNGNYFAHPWPTWSRFFDNGPGGSWKVERGIPLAGIFFLSRSLEDHAEPLNTVEAVACLLESVRQIRSPLERMRFTWEESESLYWMELDAVSELVKAIPVYILNISLTGRFWEEIEAVLGQNMAAVSAGIREGAPPPFQTIPGGENPDPAILLFGAGHIPIVYSGPSMNPVLRAPDLLDVVTYQGTQPAVGDIICFALPDDEKNVVHRIIRITGSGIQTQGDNNICPDTDLLRMDQIIGRVTGVIRGRRYQKIAGGPRGRFTRMVIRIRKSALTMVFRIFRHAKPVLVFTRKIPYILPDPWKPRIVLFSSWNNRILRLFFGASVAGEFDARRGKWTIRSPFRLLISETALPTIEKPDLVHLPGDAHTPVN